MKVNNKFAILDILKKNSKTISGEGLSKILGISRTAIWKNIKSLQGEGYNIEARNCGYKLVVVKDMLNTYEFNSNKQYTYISSTESTMEIARNLVTKDETVSGAIVIAGEQIHGKGKFSNEFKSPKGGLYFTIIYKSDKPVFHVNRYGIAAVLGVKKALKEVLNIEVDTVWPFESHLNREKISGILTEYKIENNRIKWINLGIGIKMDLQGRRRDILNSIDAELTRVLDSDNLINNYKEALNIIGNICSFNIEEKSNKGRVIDIDSMGTITLDSSGLSRHCFIGNSTMEE